MPKGFSFRSSKELGNGYKSEKPINEASRNSLIVIKEEQLKTLMTAEGLTHI